MADKKSKTVNNSGLIDTLFGTKTYKTTISSGRKSVSGLGGTPKKSQQVASNKWNKKR